MQRWMKGRDKESIAWWYFTPNSTLVFKIRRGKRMCCLVHFHPPSFSFPLLLFLFFNLLYFLWPFFRLLYINWTKFALNCNNIHLIFICFYCNSILHSIFPFSVTVNFALLYFTSHWSNSFFFTLSNCFTVLLID